MTTLAKGTIEVTGWEEAAYHEVEEQAKLASANCQAAFDGAIQGGGRSDWLLVYPPAGAPSFVGLQQVDGRLDGRAGSFSLQMTGVFEEDGPHIQWSVVPGSGTGELAGLTGSGGYSGTDFVLEYELGA